MDRTAEMYMGRAGVAAVVGVLFLAAPASNFITGQTIYLDGGITVTQ